MWVIDDSEKRLCTARRRLTRAARGRGNGGQKMLVTLVGIAVCASLGACSGTDDTASDTQSQVSEGARSPTQISQDELDEIRDALDAADGRLCELRDVEEGTRLFYRIWPLTADQQKEYRRLLAEYYLAVADAAPPTTRLESEKVRELAELILSEVDGGVDFYLWDRIGQRDVVAAEESIYRSAGCD